MSECPRCNVGVPSVQCRSALGAMSECPHCKSTPSTVDQWNKWQRNCPTVWRTKQMPSSTDGNEHESNKLFFGIVHFHGRKDIGHWFAVPSGDFTFLPPNNTTGRDEIDWTMTSTTNSIKQIELLLWKSFSSRGHVTLPFTGKKGKGFIIGDWQTAQICLFHWPKNFSCLLFFCVGATGHWRFFSFVELSFPRKSPDDLCVLWQKNFSGNFLFLQRATLHQTRQFLHRRFSNENDDWAHCSLPTTNNWQIHRTKSNTFHQHKIVLLDDERPTISSGQIGSAVKQSVRTDWLEKETVLWHASMVGSQLFHRVFATRSLPWNELCCSSVCSLAEV